MCSSDDSMGESDDPLHFANAMSEDNVSGSRFALPGDDDEDQVAATPTDSLTDSSADLCQPLPGANDASDASSDDSEIGRVGSSRDIQAAARDYSERSFSIVRFDPQSKHNRDRDFLTRDYPPECFGPDDNIGLRTGRNANGLVDIDVDDLDLAKVMSQFVPPGTPRFGRPSRRSGHYFVCVPGTDPIRKRTFELRDRRLAELRGDRHATTVPPSFHPSGELLTWEHEAEPPVMALDDVWTAIGSACAATLLIELWEGPASSRHDVTLEMSGALIQLGLAEDRIAHIYEVVHAIAEPDHLADSLAGLRTTSELVNAGEAIAGLGALEERFGAPFVRAMKKWFPPTVPTTATGTAQDGRPIIDVREHDLVRLRGQACEALEAANTQPRLFRQGGQLVRVEIDPADGTLLVQPLTEDRLCHELANAALWVRSTARGRSVVAPPRDVVRDILAMPNPPFPRLERVVTTPVFTPDARILTTPGYDPPSRTFYHPPHDLAVPPVPVQPSSDDLTRARAIINEVIGDFPFASDADRTHAVGELVQPFLRSMIIGATPFYSHEAPTAGNGKDLLAEMVMTPAAGDQLASMAYTKQPEEMRKKITATMRKLPIAVMMANVNDKLDSGDLCDMITRGYWEDRELGRSENLRVPVTCVFITSGNNPLMSKEMSRRCVRVRIDAGMERPWEREDFRHPDLPGWVRAHRGAIIWAALTLGQHWIASGQKPGTKTLGGFESWVRVIGGVLQANGFQDFLANQDALHLHADMETAPWAALVDEWANTFGEDKVGAADLFSIASEIDGFDFGRGDEQARRTSFGMQLSGQRDRIYGDYQIVHAGVRKRASQWRLCPASRGPAPSDEGSSAPPRR